MVYTYPTNITGMGEILVYANSITNGYYGSMTLAVFAAVMFFIIGADDRALIVAGFGGLMMSMFLNIMGVVDSMQIMIYLGVTLIGMLWNWTKS